MNRDRARTDSQACRSHGSRLGSSTRIKRPTFTAAFRRSPVSTEFLTLENRQSSPQHSSGVFTPQEVLPTVSRAERVATGRHLFAEPGAQSVESSALYFNRA